jgi:hypothetical protein
MSLPPSDRIDREKSMPLSCCWRLCLGSGFDSHLFGRSNHFYFLGRGLYDLTYYDCILFVHDINLTGKLSTTSYNRCVVDFVIISYTTNMTKRGLWITAQKDREKKLRELRNIVIIDLANQGFSYGDIETVVRIDRGGAYRVVKSKSVTRSKAGA